MVKILLGCTGSVATIKLPLLLSSFLKNGHQVRVVVTEHSKHFFDSKDIPESVEIYEDLDEWNTWTKRGDPVLHIELAKWADIFLIAPLDANTLAKISNVKMYTINFKIILNIGVFRDCAIIFLLVQHELGKFPNL